MTSNAGRSTFPGHFTSSRSPSPPSSPPYQPRDAGTRKANGQGLQIPLAAGSDFNLPGAYPTSPRISQTGGALGGTIGAHDDASMRGAIQRFPSGEVNADATRGCGSEEQADALEHRGRPEVDFGSKDSSVEVPEKSIGSMTLNNDRDRSTAEENRTSSIFSNCFRTTHCHVRSSSNV